MKVQVGKYQAVKNYIHIFHAAVLFLAILLTIAIFTRNGKSDGQLGWYFGLCFLSIPGLIYLVMAPMWSRARRFSNVYAFATTDTFLAICWLTAWIETAVYVASGKGKGDKKDASGCDNFKYGSPGRCKLSTGITILGVLMMVGFCVTSLFSFRAVMYHKRGEDIILMPNQEQVPNTHNFNSQAHEDAFSSSMPNNDELEDADPPNFGYRTYRGYHQPELLRDDDYPPVYQKHDHDEYELGRDPHQPISPLTR